MLVIESAGPATMERKANCRELLPKITTGTLSCKTIAVLPALIRR
jgi:hypothetical protein